VSEVIDGVGGRGERAAMGEGVAHSLESRAGAGPPITQGLAPDLESCGRGQVSSEGVELAADVVVDRQIAVRVGKAANPRSAWKTWRSAVVDSKSVASNAANCACSLAGVDLATLDPFVHMDQMGEVDYAPGEPKGTPWHPTAAWRPSPT
jgi:hypothetical protein